MRTGPWTVVFILPTSRPSVGGFVHRPRLSLGMLVCDTEAQLGEVLARHPDALTFPGRLEPVAVSLATKTVVLWGKQ